MSNEKSISRVGHFEKVSLEQFNKDMKEEFCGKWRDIYLEDDYMRKMWDDIMLPTRATVGSAGYDFKSPFDFGLEPGGVIKIPTGIRAIINDGWFLGCVPRSGMGFKFEVRLANTFGVIDSSYSESSNEGHIYVKLRNGEKFLPVNKGDGIFQALLIPHGITSDDNVTTRRNGGFGSTDNAINNNK